MIWLLTLGCGSSVELEPICDHHPEVENIPTHPFYPFMNASFSRPWAVILRFDRLAEMCDEFGRIRASLALEQAGDWVQKQLEADGLTALKRQPVTVQHWIRGQESLELLSPRTETLPMLGLGMSIGTEGLRLKRSHRPRQLRCVDEQRCSRHSRQGGLINQPFEDYGKTVKIRMRGPTGAAKLGARAALIRSVAPHGHQTPHTGATSYDGVHQIPAAAISLEDAERLSRFKLVANRSVWL